MSIFENEEVYMTTVARSNSSVAFYNDYMYIANYNTDTIYHVNLSDMKLEVLIAFEGYGPSLIKVYGNTLYVSCYDINKIISIDLTATMPIAKTVVDASSDGLFYGFNGFVINNGYMYIGCKSYAYVYCYNISTNTRTIIDGSRMFNFVSGIGVYNNYLYISSDTSIIRLHLSVTNAYLLLIPTDTDTVYSFSPNIYINNYTVNGFEIYFNNAIITITDYVTTNLIHINLDNTFNITVKTISPSIYYSSSSWPTIYNKYIYIPCNIGSIGGTIIRVRANLNCFQDDTIIFPNKGSDWKFEINCSHPFIKVNYTPTLFNSRLIYTVPDKILMTNGSALFFPYKNDTGNFYPANTGNFYPANPGRIYYNNPSQQLATSIFISYLDDNSVDIDAFLDEIHQSDILYIQDKMNSLNWIKYTIIQMTTVLNNYRQLTVSYLSSEGNGATSFGNNKPIFFAIFTNTSLIQSQISALQGKTVNQSAPVSNQTNFTGTILTDTIKITGGNPDELLKANGSVDRTVYLNSAGGIMAGDLNMNTKKIINLAPPTSENDATNRTYVDTEDAKKLNKDGTIAMTGNLDMNTENKIIKLAPPTSDNDATNKNYVDIENAKKLNLSGGTLTGLLNTAGITNTGEISSGSYSVPNKAGFLNANGSIDTSTYLTTSLASSTYLTTSLASSTYLTSSLASSTYLTSSIASSTYLTSSIASSTYLTSSTASSNYLTKTEASDHMRQIAMSVY